MTDPTTNCHWVALPCQLLLAFLGHFPIYLVIYIISNSPYPRWVVDVVLEFSFSVQLRPKLNKNRELVSQIILSPWGSFSCYKTLMKSLNIYLNCTKIPSVQKTILSQHFKIDYGNCDHVMKNLLFFNCFDTTFLAFVFSCK